MIIDSHCHLDKLDTSHYTDGFAGLIAAAQANDVSQMLCISVDTEKFDPMMAQIAAYVGVLLALSLVLKKHHKPQFVGC